MYQRIHIVFALAVVILFGGVVRADSPRDDADDSGSIQNWIRDLSSPDYHTRENATIGLSKAGKAAVGPVAAAVKRNDAEVSWRAFQILQQISAGDDESAARAAYESLQSLAQSGDSSIAHSAEKALTSWRQLRKNVVIRKIRALGGRVQTGAGAMGMMVAPPVFGGVVEEVEVRPAIAPPAAEDIEEAMMRAMEAMRIRDIEVKPAQPAKAKPASKPPAVKPKSKPKRPAKPDKAKAFDPKALSAALKSIVESSEKDKPAPPAAPTPAPAPAAPRVERFGLRRADVVLGGEVIVFGGDLAMASGATNNSVSVQLDRNWKGGDEGLRHLSGLEDLLSLQLNDAPLTDAALDQIVRLTKLRQLHITGAKLTVAGLRKLRQKRPNLAITATGTALIGVSGQANGRGFVVSTVAPNSGALAAEMKVGDVIVEINDQKVRHIGDLMIEVFQKDPGDKISLKVARDDGVQTIEVVLRPR